MDSLGANLDKIDPELKDFIVKEQIKTQIQAQIRKLNTLCFEKDSEGDQTFHLIRLPKEATERIQSGSSKVGTILIYDDGKAEFQDDTSLKARDRQQQNFMVANEESDLFKISLQKAEAVHLGKVKLSTLLAVPKADERDVSTVFG